ncbi:MAG: DUF2993 domain-containing protein [Rubrobacter sp.]|nr:DUF2993 domain-containing protein [Rubrobacter sp.]
MFSGAMWTAFVSVAVVAAVFVVGPFTFLPSVVGGLVAQNIQADFGLAEAPEVELRNDDAPLEMLLGEFTGGEVSMRGAEFGGVRTESVDVDLDPFDVDMRESITSRSLRSEDLRGDLRIEISEEEVARLAESRADVPVSGVDLSGEEMVVDTSVSLLGNAIPVSVRGGVGFEGGGISFLPGSIAIAGASLPEETTADILEELEVSFELEGLPSGTEIQEAGVEEGAVVLTGRTIGL